mgnify:CR=1 FL=1
MTETTNEDSFPFEIVVVTFPDEGAARVASEGPLRDLERVYPHTTFVSTCDPMGCRCGSGGGTLAALEEVRGSNSDSNKTILILHAGGDSSRCFTQMALGKAWTNLPLLRDDGSTLWSNPIQLGMDSIARIFSGNHQLPPGSIVIAASDSLLSIPHYKQEQELWGENEHSFQSDVLGVTFPAPWETARNHGVYVLSEATSQSTNGSSKVAKALEVPIQKVLQKPSMEILQREIFAKVGTTQAADGLAWIDNGIIVFLPRAANALQHLARGVLNTTTKSGLLKAYQERIANEPNLTYQSLTYKVDLYTHFLQAMTIQGTNSASHREVYLKDRASGLKPAVATGIFEALSSLTFQAFAIPEGKFLHLGTTKELKDFYVYGCMRTQRKTNDNPTRYELYTQNCTFFGRELGMVRHLDIYSNIRMVGENCVLMGSVLAGDQNSSFIGEGSVLEFCCLTEGSSRSSIQIGKNCLVSGLRQLNRSKAKQGHLKIPDNTVVQMMPLMQQSDSSDNASADSSFVFVALGVDDPIKKPIKESTFFGIKMETFMKWAGLSTDDLWDDPSGGTLWDAKLHPVVTEASGLSFSDVWDWSNVFQGENSSSLTKEANEALLRWKSQPRLSLSQVRGRSDAASEFRYRDGLLHSILPTQRKEHCREIADILWKRRHDECDFYTLIPETMQGFDGRSHSDSNSNCRLSSEATLALTALDDVIRGSILNQNQYDICGRTLMVSSALLDDLAKGSEANGNEALKTTVQEKCQLLLKTIHSPVSSGNARQEAYNKLATLRDESISSAKENSLQLKAVLGAFSIIMESIARMMTEICVSGFLHDDNIVDAYTERKTERKQSVVGQWIVSTAPARIDLSGGWSDTPPVCYEYCSSVTGVAVNVDGKKPLSCRCRIVPRSKPFQGDDNAGVIFLRSELRDSKTCDLVSSLNLELQSLDDLRDARDPNAPCALIKCALICLGLISIKELEHTKEADVAQDYNLQSYVNRFCQMSDGQSARLEIVIVSLLPQGSGMGTSSILGGCVLAAVGHCVGIEHSILLDRHMPDASDSGVQNDRSDIIDAVSALEQVLSTGGGFQDQVNGLIGGLKMVSSKANQLPIHLTIEPLEINPTVQKSLDDSLMLAFTGKTRLAKNILQNVLRRWARRTPEVVDTVEALVNGAHKAKDALLAGDLVSVGQCLDEYYMQKKHMAGEDSGVEPEFVRRILDRLNQEKLICGASLCGAGGGGFLVMMASPGVDKDKIQAMVAKELASSVGTSENEESFSWHGCQISMEGLTTMILPKAENQTATFFDKSWHSVEATSTESSRQRNATA